MKRQQIIPINLVLLAIWTWMLMTYVTIYKTEVWLLDVNPYYDATIWVLYFLALVYAHFFVTRNTLLNLIITTLLFKIFLAIGFELVASYMHYLEKADKGKTPLGWTFKYRFLDIAIVNVLLLLAFEVVRVVIPVKWRTM